MDPAKSSSPPEYLDSDRADALLVALREHAGDEGLAFAEAPARLTGGYSAGLYGFRLDEAPDELAGRLVLRILRAADDAEREINAQREVAELGFPAPAVAFAADSSVGLGGPFMVMEHVEGRTLFEAPLPEMRRLPVVLGEVMGRLHALDPDPVRAAFSIAGWPEGELGAERVLTEVSEAIDVAGSAPLADGLSWLVQNRPPRVPDVICHGDLHPGNMLTRDGRLVALLDWELATLAEPEFDVARTVVLLRSAPGGESRAARWLRQRLGRLACRRFLATYAIADPDRLRWYEALHCLRIIALGAEAAIGSQRQAAPVVELWAPLTDQLAGRFARITGVEVDPG